MTGIELIAKERQEQIEKHGHTLENDDKLVNGELLKFARYLISSDGEYFPPINRWHKDFVYQMFLKPRIEQLQIAGAFIAAEIDRLQRINS
jgi:hypothetical protein